MNDNELLPEPLRSIFKLSVRLFIFLIVIYIVLQVAHYSSPYVIAQYLPYNDNGGIITDGLGALAADIKMIGVNSWEFISPFLQLVLLLFIIQWVLKRLGLDLSLKSSAFDWNVQSVIAIVVIVSLAIAVLIDVNGAHMLKDIALVVVGFYFGTQKKTIEITDGNNSTKITEKHSNERGNPQSNDKSPNE